MAEAAEPPAQQPASVYADRRSLLFGLHGLTFDESSGARSTEGADFAASTDELLGSFHAAQTNAAARRREAGASSLLDDKVRRKHAWAELGVPPSLLVPTLMTCELEHPNRNRNRNRNRNPNPNRNPSRNPNQVRWSWTRRRAWRRRSSSSSRAASGGRASSPTPSACAPPPGTRAAKRSCCAW